MDGSENEQTESERLAEWHRYYSAKRIGQQWTQVHLLRDLPVQTVLEVGPYMGLATAMMDNAGYDVTTLDLVAHPFERPARPHIRANLLDIEPDAIAGFDAIVCCETLEHLPWRDVGRVLETFCASGAKHLILSVPYSAFQIDLSLYVNRHLFRKGFAFKKLRFLKSFTPDVDPLGHKWEVGYRGTNLTAWEAKLRGAGWRIMQREFTSPTRSVFHVLEPST
ncbi:MAG: hypothetical protein O7F69_12265 [Alphaproteobacteria bacterium]|nr:hypothetical protein [Alphaproteobacteria bacterium]